jgi:hypothetical protein
VVARKRLMVLCKHLVMNYDSGFGRDIF